MDPLPRYSLKISPNAKRYHLEVDWEKGLVVVVPRRWSQESVKRLLQEKSRWIGRHVDMLALEKKAADGHLQRRALLKRDMASIFQVSSNYWAKVMGLRYRKFTLRDQKTKWGSCSRDGNLNFNYNLAYAPEEVRDYVIVHELAHLIVPNHSPKFWQLVGKYIPDHKECRKWLRQNGRILANAGLVHR